MSLPSYNQSIKGFVPPPSYHDVIVTSTSTLLPNDHSSAHFYKTQTIDFINIEDLDEITDEQVLGFFETMQMDSMDYQLKTEEEIKDLIKSVEMMLNDKLSQINRNASFIEKRIITRSYNYYINNLRLSTFKDFMRISTRVVLELSSLYEDLYFPLTHFNSLYQSTNEIITCLEAQLSSSLKTHEPKEITSQISKELYKNHYKLAQIKYNLNLIQSKINQLINCDDVSYVLKERARVYNDAKEIVSNQRRACLLYGRC